VNLAGKSITSATLTFHNISNWDKNANMLFILFTRLPLIN